MAAAAAAMAAAAAAATQTAASAVRCDGGEERGQLAEREIGDISLRAQLQMAVYGTEQQFAHWHFGARRDLSACFAHLRTLRTVPRVWRVINKPLEKKQVSSHSGANAAINGALHVTIPAPLELHQPMIVILFILRRLRAVIFKNDPAHVLMGLPGNKSVQVHIDNYTDFINELGRLHLALDRYGIYSFRNATATAICTAAKMQEEQGHHQLAATTLARGAQLLDTSIARFVTAYNQDAGRDLSMLPGADMTYDKMCDFSAQAKRGRITAATQQQGSGSTGR
ncbi:hypothetical protein JKP88DRAFT_348761 [Tribonema minus]|uniref:Uncharacterized protein n=1 Tax=Tribonema minus TaxID=303371 RepID=A0A835YWP9_9STRA|nr:hypothetical protein JKP88DRAFT_348761 [Tribonema minus]